MRLGIIQFLPVGFDDYDDTRWRRIFIYVLSNGSISNNISAMLMSVSINLLGGIDDVKNSVQILAHEQMCHQQR